MEVSAHRPGIRHHYRGRYVIRTRWDGGVLLYEVLLGTAVIAEGFDMLARDEETALEGILGRRNGEKQRVGGIR